MPEFNPQNYYVHLCREQSARYEAFQAANPDVDELTRRQQFFGSRHESSISRTIIQNIGGSRNEYNPKHPVKS